MNEDYITAAMVGCPKCSVGVGKPCRERYCRNGYRECQYAICSAWRDRSEPHLERAVKARLAALDA